MNELCSSSKYLLDIHSSDWQNVSLLGLGVHSVGLLWTNHARMHAQSLKSVLPTESAFAKYLMFRKHSSNWRKCAMSPITLWSMVAVSHAKTMLTWAWRRHEILRLHSWGTMDLQSETCSRIGEMLLQKDRRRHVVCPQPKACSAGTGSNDGSQKTSLVHVNHYIEPNILNKVSMWVCNS